MLQYKRFLLLLLSFLTSLTLLTTCVTLHARLIVCLNDSERKRAIGCGNPIYPNKSVIHKTSHDCPINLSPFIRSCDFPRVLVLKLLSGGKGRYDPFVTTFPPVDFTTLLILLSLMHADVVLGCNVQGQFILWVCRQACTYKVVEK